MEKTASGKYRDRYTWTEDGVRHSKSFTASTKTEVRRMIDEFKQKKTPTIEVTIEEAFNRFMELNSNILSPSTIRGYKAYFKSQFKSIQHYKIGSFSDSVCQRWINTLAEKYAPKTVKNCFGLLSRILSPYRVSLSVSLPQKVKIEVRIPSESEVRKIISDTADTPLELPVLLAAQMGLRRSEICGLKWENINLKNKTIHIKEVIVRGEYGDEAKPPKSFAGDRILPMTEAVYRYLSSHQDLCTLSSDSITHAFLKLCRENGYPYHFHHLRHYYCSVCLSLGVPTIYIQQLMGHGTDTMIQRVYGHILEAKKQEVQNQVTEFFK